jgi:hypothetical protein
MKLSACALVLAAGIAVLPWSRCYAADAPSADSTQADLAAVKRLLKNDPKNKELLGRATDLAIRTEDYPDAIRFVQAQLADAPDNFRLHIILPVLYMMAHDQNGFDRERDVLVKMWQNSNDPAFKQRKFFLVESFKVDDTMVRSRQCFGIGGRYGVKYVFDFGKPGSPPGKVTLEVNYLEGLISSEIHGRLPGDQHRCLFGRHASHLDAAGSPARFRHSGLWDRAGSGRRLH